MLGLKKEIVQVVPHQASWAELYEQERRALQEQVGHYVLGIEHVGSTSVPGLAAKPVIDIAVAVDSVADITRCRQDLEALGFIYRGDAGRDGGHVFVKEREPQVRTHHVHLVAIDDPQWGNYQRFRELLRADATLRARYEAVKRTLQERYPRDRRAYTTGKDDFVRGALSGHRPT